MNYCQCRDCFEITYGDYCQGCEDADCPSYEGESCQQEDAYNTEGGDL